MQTRRLCWSRPWRSRPVELFIVCPYCPSCFNALKASAAARNAKAAASCISDPEFERLSRYLCGVFSIDGLTPLLRKQLRDFREERGWTWRSIYHAARYFFELVPHDEDPAPTLGILPYIYDEAMSYWGVVRQAEAYNAKARLNDTTIRAVPSHTGTAIPSSCHIEDL